MQAAKTYFGGKGSDGTYQTIINQIPKHELFIETCAGLARITEHLESTSSITILNDISSDVLEILKDKFKGRLIDSSLLFTTKNFDACHGKIIIENLDSVELLEKYSDLINSLNTVIFCDPPYPLSSRKSQKKVYKFEMEDSKHQELLKYLNKMSCSIIICSYPNPIYENCLKHWRKIEYLSQTRKGLALENLFLNYDTARHLQTTKFYGKDYREREKWKKVKQNLIRKINELPEQIRNEIKISLQQ